MREKGQMITKPNQKEAKKIGGLGPKNTAMMNIIKVILTKAFIDHT